MLQTVRLAHSKSKGRRVPDSEMYGDRKLKAVRDQQFQNEKKIEPTVWIYCSSMRTVVGIQVKLPLTRGQSETASADLYPNKSLMFYSIRLFH